MSIRDQLHVNHSSTRGTAIVVFLVTQIIFPPLNEAVESCENVQVVEAKEWVCKTVERDLEPRV